MTDPDDTGTDPELLDALAAAEEADRPMREWIGAVLDEHNAEMRAVLDDATRSPDDPADDDPDPADDGDDEDDPRGGR